MLGSWVHKKVLITVRTYPTPAWKGVEVSCTAGITDSGEWIRLFPMPYRLLPENKRFKKYQWIELNVKKASNDFRPESYHPDIESISIASNPIPTKQFWQLRKDLVFHLKAPSLCDLKSQRDTNGNPTLGIFKPKTISAFVIEKTTPDWTPAQLARLRQSSFYGTAPAQELEKLPYNFSYRFKCNVSTCSGHELMCTDWEIGESYRQWIVKYGSNWERYFRNRYETEMILANDTHFFVGTMHEHPGSWLIIGLFYPKVITTNTILQLSGLGPDLSDA